jgi:amino acid transporter
MSEISGGSTPVSGSTFESQGGATEGVGALKRYDVKVSGIVFMLYCLVAAGAFGIEEMIPGGPGLTIILLAVFPLIWSLPISNMVAEAASLKPQEGGIYTWVRDAFGEFWGFQAGWYNAVSIYIGNSVFAALAVDYASHYILVLADPNYLWLKISLKIAIVIIFTIINLLGIQDVGRVDTVLAIIILIAFGLVAVVGFANWHYNPVMPIIAEGYSFSEALSGMLAICIWMYCGYECISMFSGEVKNTKVIPKGLLIAMPVIAVSYLLPTIAGLGSVGDYANWGTGAENTGYTTVLSASMPQAFGYVFLFFAIISNCAIFNSYLAAGGRSFFVLADDNLCPRFLTKVSKKRGVPYVGILSIAAVNAVLCQFEFTTLVMTTVLFTLALYLLLPLAVCKLRKDFPIGERRAKGLYVMKGPALLYALPVLIIAVCSFILNGSDYFVIGIIACSTGPLFYYICKVRYGGRKDMFPLNGRTRLAAGDLRRFSFYGLVAGALSIVGSFVLRWFEADWGTEYYAAEGESAFFRDWEWTLGLLLWLGVGLLVFGIVMRLLGRKYEK